MRILQKKTLPGQVRSSTRVGLLTLLQKTLQSPQRVFFRVFHGAISSFQVFITVSVYVICISQDFYIGDLRSGQSRDISITSLCENIEMHPASNERPISNLNPRQAGIFG